MAADVGAVFYHHSQGDSIDRLRHRSQSHARDRTRLWKMLAQTLMSAPMLREIAPKEVKIQVEGDKKT